MESRKREYERNDIVFRSRGTRCTAWLYLPTGIPEPPVVLMAHGFGAERVLGLPPFAERFAAAGLAVFLFDYRNFGDSDGEPRKLVDPGRHLEDWRAAIALVRTLDSVNRQKIALWGTSFSGGHVLTTAASVSGITAVVAQVPFVDGLASALYLGLPFVAHALVHGFRDLWRAATRQEPHYVPLVSDPEHFAVMNRPDSMTGYSALVPEGYSWDNRCPARILLRAPLYRPRRHARKISCPTMIVLARNDSLIPASAVDKTARKIPQCSLLELPVGHFDIYSGEAFDKTVRAETDFLTKYLI